MGSFRSSIESSVKSTRSKFPSRTACAGRPMPAMRTLGLVRAAEPTTCWAVMTRPFPKYTPRQVPTIVAGLARYRLRRGWNHQRDRSRVGKSERCQSCRCQEESDRKTQSWPRLGTHEKCHWSQDRAPDCCGSINSRRDTTVRVANFRLSPRLRRPERWESIPFNGNGFAQKAPLRESFLCKI